MISPLFDKTQAFVQIARMRTLEGRAAGLEKSLGAVYTKWLPSGSLVVVWPLSERPIYRPFLRFSRQYYSQRRKGVSDHSGVTMKTMLVGCKRVGVVRDGKYKTSRKSRKVLGGLSN